eukprot:Skav226920  [mRNA]  locus=scaffold1147:109596:110486:+ [translate_table: standard]
MLDMGYAEDAARRALQRTGSVDAAIDLIASEDTGEAFEAPRARSRSPRRAAPVVKAPVKAPAPVVRPRKLMESLADKARNGGTP